MKYGKKKMGSKKGFATCSNCKSPRACMKAGKCLKGGKK